MQLVSFQVKVSIFGAVFPSPVRREAQRWAGATKAKGRAAFTSCRSCVLSAKVAISVLLQTTLEEAKLPPADMGFKLLLPQLSM